MKRPPQPKGSFLFGHYKLFKKDPLKLLLTASEECGDIFMLRVLTKKIYFINHPDLVEYILQTNYKNYTKTPNTPLRIVVGNGIFTSDGEEWVKRRKLYQPSLNRSSVQSYTSDVVECTEQMLGEFSDRSKPINFSRQMTKLTISILSEALFSTNIVLDTNLWEDMDTIMKWVGERRLRRPFFVPASWPTKKNNKFRGALKRLDQVIYQIIENKKQESFGSNDLVSRFMNPEEDDQWEMSPKELRDEVMSIFLAGHETSANVLSWTFYQLATHPEVQQKIFDEVNTLGEKALTFKDLNSLQYTTQVLNETMRLFPPIWHFGRSNIQIDKIGGYTIPKRTYLRISPITIQRRQDYWKNPESFNPDRFAENKSKGQTPFTHIPFGAGPRMCPGRNFAMMEMVLIVAMVVRKFKLSYKGEKIEMAPLLTLRTNKDVLLDITIR